MAGLAAEGLKYDKVIGQSADLFSLQVSSDSSGPFDDFHHFDFLMKFILLLILPFSFQRFINRTKPPISKEQQQNLTRWAVSPRLQSVHLGLFSNNLIPTKQQWNLLQVLFAASLLKTNVPTHEALVAAMSKKASVLECMEAIENAA